MVSTIATQNGYLATIATQNRYVATLRDRRSFMRLCATQTRYVATLLDPKKVCCDHCDSKWVCCDFMRAKCLRDFARPKTVMLRLCATEEVLCDFARLKQDMFLLCSIQKRYVATIATQNGYVATLCERNVCATLRDPKQLCCDFAQLMMLTLKKLLDSFVREFPSPLSSQFEVVRII